MAHSTANIKLDPGPSSRQIKKYRSGGFFLGTGGGGERTGDSYVIIIARRHNPTLRPFHQWPRDFL